MNKLLHGQRLRVVADGLVEILKLESLVAALGDLAHDSGRLTSDDAETRDNHIGRNDSVWQDAHIVLDDCELAHDCVLADVDVRSDGGRLHDGALADKNVVSKTEW